VNSNLQAIEIEKLKAILKAIIEKRNQMEPIRILPPKIRKGI